MTGRHVVVVGAGPAGLAAAEAALRAGAEVTLIDTAEQPGGQYHRMLPDAYEAAHPGRLQHGRRAFDRRRRHVLTHPHCTWLPGTSVWALERPAPGEPGPPRVHVLRGPCDGAGRPRHVLAPDALVLATGAHDRVLPFPGWDLPGVFTAGAAQALAKGERVVVGDRVVVAGTGPFLLPVAASLLEAGSQVLEVLEANVPGTVARGWSHRPWDLTAQAGKAGELLRYGAVLIRHRVPWRSGRAVVEARGDGRVEEVVTARLRPDWSVVPGTCRTTAVDALCVTHGFTPQLELALAAGCALRAAAGAEFVEVDDDQRTSSAAVYAAGEITGIAGAPAARAEGLLAGWIAGGGRASPALRRLRRQRDQGRAFADRLDRAHPVGAAWPGWLRPETVVCRCEETDYAALCRAAADAAGGAARVAKLTTRAGLGPCQARICGPTVAALAERLRAAPPPHDSVDGQPVDGPVDGLPPASPHRRPIAQPIRLGDLARPPDPIPDDPYRTAPAAPARRPARPARTKENDS
ncbi:FAD-dependent oxidoreductase [Streptomyces sp. NPDC096176]|uniref:FAD-dependent oxidoreductase n=1 Tax=Streptomyces sp. NPDC096176 TaxID=3366079 RepID=UPI003824FE95